MDDQVQSLMKQISRLPHFYQNQQHPQQEQQHQQQQQNQQAPPQRGRGRGRGGRGRGRGHNQQQPRPAANLVQQVTDMEERLKALKQEAEQAEAPQPIPKNQVDAQRNVRFQDQQDEAPNNPYQDAHQQDEYEQGTFVLDSAATPSHITT